MVGVVSPLLLPLPSKTSSLSCEAFFISSKFDWSLVEGKQRWQWPHEGGATPWGNICSHSHSTKAQDLYALPVSEKPHIHPEDATRDLYALPISEKQHIHIEDGTQDQMQRLICMLCQSVKSNTSTLNMQLEIKYRDLSVRSANQWKATHPQWG